MYVILIYIMYSSKYTYTVILFLFIDKSYPYTFGCTLKKIKLNVTYKHFENLKF